LGVRVKRAGSGPACRAEVPGVARLELCELVSGDAVALNVNPALALVAAQQGALRLVGLHADVAVAIPLKELVALRAEALAVAQSLRLA